MQDAPTLTAQDVRLCLDTAGSVWLQILSSPAASRSAAKVCVLWRRFLIARFEQVLLLSSFPSLACVPRFQSVHTVDVRGTPWLNDAALQSLALLPTLRHIKLACVAHAITSNGVDQFVRALGPRLLTYEHTSDSLDLGMIRAVARAPALQTLSMSLGDCGRPTDWKYDGTHGDPPLPYTFLADTLNGCISLRHLTLDFIGPHPFQLPYHLPALRTLSITTRENCGFIWPQKAFEGLAFMGIWPRSKEAAGGNTPLLERITIEDRVSNPRSGLSFRFLSGWVCGLTVDVAAITLTHAGTASNVDNDSLPWTFTVAGICGLDPEFPTRHDYEGPLDDYMGDW